jgi:hypothetical protein
MKGFSSVMRKDFFNKTLTAVISIFETTMNNQFHKREYYNFHGSYIEYLKN